MAARIPLPSPPTPSPFPNTPKASPPKHPSKAESPSDTLVHCLHSMTQGHLPSKPTLISSMKACSLLFAIQEGRAIHAHVVKAGLGGDNFIATSVIGFYSSCGLLDSARQVLDRILKKDVVLQTAMLVGYVENGEIEKARSLFDEMVEKDVIAWNAMISGCTHSGRPENALKLFREMQILNLRPSEATLVSALSACSQLGCLALGEWIHAYINRHLDSRVSPTLDNALIHMYAKCGRLDAALSVFLEKRPRNLESWNAMLSGFAINGSGTSALSLFSQMIKLGMLPDRISFIGVLMACGHAGLVDHAYQCFDCMTRLYGIKPEVQHYGCLVDVLSRGGYLDEAWMLLRWMHLDAGTHAWGALLSGCLTHCNYGLGLEAAWHLLELDPREEGRYIALLNLYGMIGRTEEAAEVRKLMVEMGIKQSSGRSMIEVDGVVHEFLAGGASHFSTKECLLND